ncbi:hypothetical protein P5V15_002855 [Pogonomyrmex californicus]
MSTLIWFSRCPGGAVDGTHIKISAPKDNNESYINRKGFHSLQLQVGSIRDMRVFRLSNVESLCTNQNFPHDSHILGNATYYLTKHVMIPFKDNGHLSERQINFNKILIKFKKSLFS